MSKMLHLLMGEPQILGCKRNKPAFAFPLKTKPFFRLSCAKQAHLLMNAKLLRPRALFLNLRQTLPHPRRPTAQGSAFLRVPLLALALSWIFRCYANPHLCDEQPFHPVLVR
jgi:hypothetical protein